MNVCLYYSYLKLQTQVQDNLASVNTKNKFVEKESARLQREMETEKQMAKAAKLAEEALENERKHMVDELDVLKQNRDKWMDAAGRI